MAEVASPELLAAVLFSALVMLFCILAGLLDRWLVTAPLAFVTIGAVIGFALGPVDTEAVLGIRTLAELTLVLILFHDAAQVRPRQIGAEGTLVARLLLVGFPLTILLGYGLARLIFPDLDPMMALLLATALAPTDAGLGAATVLNPAVPVGVRRLLNVESGLNDGLATPVVLFAIAVVAGQEGLGPAESLAGAAVELTIGVAVGAAVGAGSGLLLGISRNRGLSTRGSRVLALLMVPFLSYGLALLASGNGFVAAFVSGTALAGVSGWLAEEDPLTLAESVSDLLGAAVWLVFGLAAVPFIWRGISGAEVLFGLLALTVMRMLPVAVSLLGTRLRTPTVAFIGWFGPRGLASVIFALIALESLDVNDDLRTLVACISFTVLVSVIAHGFSAEPLARRFGAWSARSPVQIEHRGSRPPHSRRGVPAPGTTPPTGP